MALAYGFTEYGGPETQQFLDLPVATPGPGQVQVAVVAAGVNPADWKVRSGLRRDSVPVALPAVLGREVAGVVTAVGEDETRFSVGDEVLGSTAAGFGGYAQSTVVNSASTAHKPATVAFTDAATIPVALGTAYDALDRLALPAGSTLLVIGAGGGVGSAALSLARLRGLNAIGIASPAKERFVTSTGARWVESGAGAGSRVGTAVDAVFDLVGGDVLADVADAASGARVVSVADPAQAAALGGGGVTRRRTSQVFGEIAQLVASGDLDAHVTRVFPFAEAGAALASVESGHAAGKVVLDVRADERLPTESSGRPRT
ncbi:NADP-dependent oxidoreductase [Rhodococcus sp. HNM0569]|uniref:NADP-dependent oxidoreductase n=1 Tax=Rhodococcus sp. HNM0569 TaxID=2716340 RepID=UPI00146C6DA1|nr:NADP-dependent oxidoreductase [Rhodococcus sp. HNM0569]NLU84431.1 NADP-dependent oxidoreductase [Rhodococcus sp. HNM0569]